MRKSTQFGLRSLFFTLIATALISWMWTSFPTLPGFDAPYSRRFLALGALGATMAGGTLAWVREELFSVRFCVRLCLAIYVATSMGYGILYFHCKSNAEAPSWPGMAMIYLLPSMFFVSAILGSLVSAILPRPWIDRLQTVFLTRPVSLEVDGSGSKPLPRRHSPTAAFLIGGNVLALGTTILCFQMASFPSGLIVAITTFWPLILTLIPMWFCYGRTAQIVFATVSFGYAAWFIYMNAFVSNSSPIRGYLGLIGMGMMTTPFLLIATILGVGLHLQETRDS